MKTLKTALVCSTLSLLSFTGAVTMANSAQAAGCTGEYALTPATLGMSAAAALAWPGGNISGSAGNDVDLDPSGQLPADFFDDAIADWSALIDLQGYLSDQQKDDAKASVDGAFADLHAQIDEALLRLPDRVKLVQYGSPDWFNNVHVGVHYIDDDFGRTLYREVYTNRYTCQALVAGLGAGDGVMGEGFGAGAVIQWGLDTRATSDQGRWWTGVFGLGFAEDMFLISFNLDVHGTFEVQPIEPAP